MGRGRPRRGSVRFVLTLWLDPERDADLLAWLAGLPKGERMQAFKQALRSGGMRSPTMTADDDQEALAAAEEILNAWNV